MGDSHEIPWWEGRFEDLIVRREVASGRHLAVLVLDQPQRRNAMSDAMTASWVRVVEALRADTRLAAVVVTGAGSAFCSGGDLGWLAEGGAAVPELRERMLAFYRSWLAIADLPVPTIAAINGHAVGAGLALALACDIRYVAAEARLSVPFTALGLHPGMATTWSLPRVVSAAVARDLLLTGRRVGGDEAVALGLASACVPAAQVLDRALEAARAIATAAPVATALTLEALRRDGHPDRESALQWEALAQATTMATADLHEGLAAAAERRQPRFEGR